MKPLDSNLTDLLSKIKRLKAGHSRPIVVAMDGGSGAGKSTLALMIEKEIETALIQVDDFFMADIPERQWIDFSVEERLQYVFDWHRLRDNVIKPLLAGSPARWYAFDFESGLRADGTYGMQNDPIEIEPAEVILLDGAYSASPQLSDLVDFTVFVEVSMEERHRRLALREDKEFIERWHQVWDPVEAYYFSQVRPKTAFDLVVQNDWDGVS
jgi:uridine kinase